MRYVTDIQIESVILHILDPRGRGLVLSETPLQLGPNNRISEYFEHHIRRSLAHSATKAARFRSTLPDSTSDICKGLFDGTRTLVEGSQSLAKKLYAILESDKRTKVGDLAVCFYQAGNYPGQRFLALLKIDPSEVFRHVEKTDSKGKKYVTLELESEAFTEENLQKAAFVRPPLEEQKYDMMVLDYEARNRRRRDVARYFIEDFLDAEFALDSMQQTRLFYRAVIASLNAIRPELSEKEYENVHTHLRTAITSATIDVDQWAEQLPLPTDKKQRIEERIRERLPDRSFSPDQKVVSQLLKKRRFRGQYGLKVELNADHYDDVIKVVDRIEDDPNRPPYFRVTIETEKWDEVNT